MHKGYTRRTGPIWVVVAIMTVVLLIIARAGFKSFQSAEDLYKENEVYYVNDKGNYQTDTTNTHKCESKSPIFLCYF